MDTLLYLKNEPNCRHNFALKQAERMFTYNERHTSNSQGKQGKKQLDKKRLEVIQENTLKLRPLENKEDEVRAWYDCQGPFLKAGGNSTITKDFKPRPTFRVIIFNTLSTYMYMCTSNCIALHSHLKFKLYKCEFKGV